MSTNQGNLGLLGKDGLFLVLRYLPPRYLGFFSILSKYYRQMMSEFKWIQVGVSSQEEFLRRLDYLPQELRDDVLDGQIPLNAAIYLSTLSPSRRGQVLNNELTMLDACRLSALPPRLQVMQDEPLNMNAEELWRILCEQDIPEFLQLWRQKINAPGFLAKNEYSEVLELAQVGQYISRRQLNWSCQWIGKVDSGIIPLFLKGYIPYPHLSRDQLAWRKHFLLLAQGRTQEKRRCAKIKGARLALNQLFDEGHFHRVWIDLSKSHEYLRLIRAPKSQQRHDEMMAAIREGVLTHECLATCIPSVNRFLLSPWGIEALRQKWLTPVQCMNAPLVGELVASYQRQKAASEGIAVEEVMLDRFPEDIIPPQPVPPAERESAQAREENPEPVVPAAVPGSHSVDEPSPAFNALRASLIQRMQTFLDSTFKLGIFEIKLEILNRHKQRARLLIAALSQAEDYQTLDDLINEQIGLFDPEIKRRPLSQKFDDEGELCQPLRHKVRGHFYATLMLCRQELQESQEQFAEHQLTPFTLNSLM